MAARRSAFVVTGFVVLSITPLRAQDLDAGKSGRELYAANCSSCHRSAPALARRTDAYTLYSFLRDHYTASRAMAAEVTAYLTAVGGKQSARKSRLRTTGSTPPRASSAPAWPRPAFGRDSAPPRPPADIPSR
jgi:hypothetical protein